MASEVSPSSIAFTQQTKNRGITFCGNTYFSLQDLATYIDMKLPLNQPYGAHLGVLETIKEVKNMFESIILFLFDSMKTFKSLEATLTSLQEFLSEHQDIEYRVGEIRREQTGKLGARKNVEAL
jgi:hypothetical protein